METRGEGEASEGDGDMEICEGQEEARAAKPARDPEALTSAEIFVFYG